MFSPKLGNLRAIACRRVHVGHARVREVVFGVGIMRFSCPIASRGG